MPAFAGPVKGRSILVKRGTLASETLIASVRTKSLKINGEPIDVTTDDDAGWRKLLVDPSQVSAEISVAGVAKNNTLLQEAINTTDREQSTVFEFPGGDKLQGNFYINGFTMGGEHTGHATFEATFVSSGALTFTAGA